MKWVALLALLCLISIVSSQGSCPVTGESAPFIPDLTTICSCGGIDDDDEVTSYYSENCPQPTPLSSLKVNAPTRLFDDEATPKLVRLNNIKAYSTITYQNLYLGVTYEFTTANRSATTLTLPQFDVVLVLRDPFGNVLGSNDECEFYAEGEATPAPRFLNSYISYKHESAKFNTVYLSVYQYSENSRIEGEYNCASKPARGVATIYAAAVEYDGPNEVSNFQCSTKLICIPEVTKDIYDEINPFDFLDVSSDVCGASFGYGEGEVSVDMLIDGELIVFVGDGYTEYDCSEVGESTVTIQLNGKSCQSTLIVEPTEPVLECADCYTYTVPRAPYSLCTFSNIEDAYCQFDTSDYVPFVNFVEDDDSCLSEDIQDFVFDVDYEAFFATIGQTVDYDISVTDSNRKVTSQPTSCSVRFLGIQPTTLTQYDEDNNPLPLQRGNVLNIYYDTVYSLEYFASLYNSDGCTDDIDIDIVFYTGSPNQIATRSFYPHHFRNEDCEDQDTLDCKSASYFCIDSVSEDPIEIGYYSIGLITREPWSQTPYSGIDPLNPTFPAEERDMIKKALRSVPTCGSEETTTFSPTFTKRIVGIPDLVLSLGNPRVYLDYAPAGMRPDPGTCMEAENDCFSWDTSFNPEQFK